jgi:hypothetical protein
MNGFIYLENYLQIIACYKKQKDDLLHFKTFQNILIINKLLFPKE